ncbi:MAG: flagellar type III secretion system protein FliQ [Candidatus Eisenbacteria bacterium]|uniref:Flagellar type III secretion system protein FliQ n=1 Tax=Eiseniibacteriota bacterium TaxID=2212470 RepID=A0A849SCA5_UNCEI|nr:flagellar type III secretion system protein FliQ [Candidatus Eisenbacteria bacterium]
MNSSFAVDLIRHSLTMSLTVAAPLLLTALLVGVAVSVVQAVTQLQEQTLTFLPKLVLMALVFAITLPWVLGTLVGYVVQMIRSLPSLAA